VIKELGAGFKLSGFGGPPKEQPPVYNKNGEAYNLDDPQLPIVPPSKHTFTYKYWAMPKTSRIELDYLKEHWEYFNKTRFNGQMRMPRIVLMKDVNANKMRMRGYWQTSTRTLSISPNLFNAPHEGWVNRTLIHEMCHQYVWEVEKSRDTDAHGPSWRQAMVRAGLTPNKYDLEVNETYMDKDEKEAKQKQDERYAPVLKVLNLLKREAFPAQGLRAGKTVYYPGLDGQVRSGVLVERKPKNCWLVEEEDGTGYTIPTSYLYERR